MQGVLQIYNHYKPEWTRNIQNNNLIATQDDASSLFLPVPLVTDSIDSRSRHQIFFFFVVIPAASLGVHANEKAAAAAGVEEARRKPNKRTRAEFKVCPHP